MPAIHKEIKKGYFFLLVTMLIWGAFNLVARVGVKSSLTAWDITALRFATAFIVLVPIQLWRKEWQFLLDRRIFMLGLIGGIGYCVAIYAGLMLAPAAHAAIWFNGCMPLFTSIMAWLVLREKINIHTWASLVFMLSGVLGMVLVMLYQGQFYFMLADLFFIMAAILWGLYTVLLKRWVFSPWQAMSGIAIWSAVFFLPAYVVFLMRPLPQVSYFVLLEQGIFHGVFVVIIAMLTYIGAVERLGAFKTGSLLALAPFIAAIVAVPLLQEPLNVAIGVGLAFMSMGALQPWRWIGKSGYITKSALASD